MKHATRLLLPIGLAIAAAVVNYISMRSSTRPVIFVKAEHDIKQGERFTKSNLAELELPASFESLKSTAVLYDVVGVLYDQPAARDIKAGDIIFLQDKGEGTLKLHVEPDEDVVSISLDHVDVIAPLLQIGSEIRFRFQKLGVNVTDVESVGPFRIVGKGNHFSDQPSESSDPAATRSVVVAVKRRGPNGREKKYDRLEEYCDLMAMEKAKLLRIEQPVPPGAVLAGKSGQ